MSTYNNVCHLWWLSTPQCVSDANTLKRWDSSVAARQPSPRVNFQCRFSYTYSVHTAPACNCMHDHLCTHKNPNKERHTILHTLVGMGSAALGAMLWLPAKMTWILHTGLILFLFFKSRVTVRICLHLVWLSSLVDNDNHIFIKWACDPHSEHCFPAPSSKLCQI